MKKTIALILSLVMMLSIIPCQGIMATANAVEYEPVSSLKGDANGDYHISNSDLVLIARFIVELQSDLPVLANADLNGDGTVTNADLIAVAVKIVTEPDINHTTIYNQIDESTLVMSIGDVEISWGTVYHFFYQEAENLIEEVGEIKDWTAEYANGKTYFEYCLSEAIYYDLRYIAGVEHFAKENGFTMTDDPINNIDYLYEDIMDAVVGKQGEKLTVEEIRELADTAYKAIKFVAIPKTAKNAKANAETALAAVNSAADKEAKILELIDVYCETEKAEEFKTGYVFTKGDFDDAAVENALENMEIGDVCSSVVEGKDYYYVLMRTEVDVDAHRYFGSDVPEEYRWSDYTLRSIYRDDIFSFMFWDWADYVEVDCHDVLVNALKIKNM